jgi:hypothetical protein
MGERPNIDHVSASRCAKQRQITVKSGRHRDADVYKAFALTD